MDITTFRVNILVETFTTEVVHDDKIFTEIIYMSHTHTWLPQFIKQGEVIYKTYFVMQIHKQL